MLYELVGIVRPGKVAEVKDIARTAGTTVLRSGGVIRGFTNWGIFALPKPLRDTSTTNTKSASASAQDAIKTKAISNPSLQPPVGKKHYAGHYFIMRFDSAARVQHSIRKALSLDPRIIRYTLVKMGEKFEETCDVGGKAEEWSSYGPEAQAGSKWYDINSSDSMEGVSTVSRELSRLGGFGSSTTLSRRF